MASAIARVSARLRAGGFSHRTAIPRAAAACAAGRWNFGGVQILTASGLTASSIVTASVKTRPPYSAAFACAASSTTSAMPTISQRSAWAAYARKCAPAMPPAPITAILILATDYPFKPVKAMPRTKVFCVKKKSTIVGNIANVDAAIINCHCAPYIFWNSFNPSEMVQSC